MKKILLGFTLIWSTFLFVSCEKDDEDLIVGYWLRTKLEFNNGTYWSVVTDTCLKDDIEQFKANGDWILDPGICGGIDTNSYSSTVDLMTGEWRMSSNKLTQEYDGFIGTYDSQITTLNEREMVLTFSLGTTNPLEKGRVTYKRIK